MIDLLRRYRAQDRFRLHAFVAMPDHLHLVFSPSQSLEQAVGLIKGGFSFAVRKIWRGEVWQEGYYNHRIEDEADYEAQVRYVAENPARQGYDASYPHVHTNHADMVDPKPEHLGGVNLGISLGG
jgi:putative transposase